MTTETACPGCGFLMSGKRPVPPLPLRPRAQAAAAARFHPARRRADPLPRGHRRTVRSLVPPRTPASPAGADHGSPPARAAMNTATAQMKALTLHQPWASLIAARGQVMRDPPLGRAQGRLGNTHRDPRRSTHRPGLPPPRYRIAAKAWAGRWHDHAAQPPGPSPAQDLRLLGPSSQCQYLHRPGNHRPAHKGKRIRLIRARWCRSPTTAAATTRSISARAATSPPTRPRRIDTLEVPDLGKRPPGPSPGKRTQGSEGRGPERAAGAATHPPGPTFS